MLTVTPQQFVGGQFQPRELAGDRLDLRGPVPGWLGLARWLGNISPTDQHVPHTLLQLADVSRPGIVARDLPPDERDHFVGQWSSLPRDQSAGQVLGQLFQHGRVVVQLGGQRGGLHHIGAEPVVEVFPEPPLGNLPPQVAIGRHDDLALELAVLCLSQALELSVLQHPQQLDLRGRVQLSNLVEQQGPVGSTGLQPAHPGPRGPRERAAGMAEQFRLDHSPRESRDVDGPIQLFRSGGEPAVGGVERNGPGEANRPGHQFFSAATGTRHQRGNLVEHRSQPPAITLKVVREDRLPDPGPQGGGGLRLPHHAVEDLKERPVNLVEQLEQPDPLGDRGKIPPRPVVPMLEAVFKDAPRAGVGGTIRIAQPLPPGPPTGVEVVEEEIGHQSVVQRQFVRTGGGPLVELLAQSVGDLCRAGRELQQVGPTPVDLPAGLAPVRVGLGFELGSQRLPLAFEPGGEERIHPIQPANRPCKPQLLPRQPPHPPPPAKVPDSCPSLTPPTMHPVYIDPTFIVLPGPFEIAILWHVFSLSLFLTEVSIWVSHLWH